MHITPVETVELYEIYIGIADKSSGQQLIDSQQINRLIKNVCKGNHVSFSHRIQNGGFYSLNVTDERFVFENNIVITLAGSTETEVNAIAADLCCFLNQECVMVTRHPCERYYVFESLDEEN